MKQLQGKVAVVTGAASGIGRALAQRCAREKMKVALADINTQRLRSLTQELEASGVEVLAATIDIADAEQLEAFASQCRESLGDISLLFNNAGILRVGDTWSHSPQDWDKMLRINVLGVVNGVNAFVPAMLDAQQPAHIVNTGSVGSLVAAPGMAQYTACKMAVRGITETLAYDLAARGAPIGVSLLCPGPVLTSISDDLLGIQSDAELTEASEHLMAGQPGFITPEECAEHVFDGIAANRFWIFTHSFKTYLSQQQAAIVEGSNPVYSEVTFD